VVFQFHQQLAQHITAEELVSRGATPREALCGFQHFHTIAQRPQHRGGTQHIARFAHRIQSGKARRQVRRYTHLHADLRLLAWSGKRLRPLREQTAVDGKQQKFIGQRFAGRIEVDKLAQLDCLTDSVAIARPQLDGIHAVPPFEAKDTMLSLLSTFPQRSAWMFPIHRLLPKRGIISTPLPWGSVSPMQLTGSSYAHSRPTLCGCPQ
jgi:hypothetical protein